VIGKSGQRPPDFVISSCIAQISIILNCKWKQLHIYLSRTDLATKFQALEAIFYLYTVFLPMAKFLTPLQNKFWTFLYNVQRKKSILFMHFHTKNRNFFAAIYLFTYYLNLAFWMFKIAEILSSTYKIEHFSRFLGQIRIFNMFFGHFKPIF